MLTSLYETTNACQYEDFITTFTMKKQFIAFSTLLMLAAAMKLQSAGPAQNSLISKSLSAGTVSR